MQINSKKKVFLKYFMLISFYIVDRIAAGIISELDVYCSNKNYGCKWKGVIDRLECHQKKCTAKLVAEQLNLKIELN